MREFLFFFLVAVNLPILYFLVRNRLFFKAPLFSVYYLSVFFLNVVGSCVVFFPKLNIYDSRDFFNWEFFFILLLQSLFFYFFLFFNNRLSVSFNELSKKNKLQVYRATILMISFALLILFLFYIQYGTPPLYSGDLSGGNSALMSVRTEFFDNTEKVWFYRIGFYVLPQITGILLYLLIRRNSNVMNVLLFGIYLGLVSVLALSFLHKTPVALFFVSILISKILDDRKANVGLLLRWIIGVFLIIFLWYLIYFPGQDPFYYLDFMMRSILNRIFGSYPMGLAMVVEVVKEQGFFYGTTMNNPMGLLPYDVINLAEIVHWKLFNIKGSHPPPAVGYAYADFGWLGVVVTLLFINIYLLFIQKLLGYIKNRALYIALVSYLSIRVMFLAMSSASEILLNAGDVITLMLILVTYVFAFTRIK